MKKIISSSITTALLLPVMVFAQPTAPTVVTSYSQVVTVIKTIGNWMFGILLALAGIFIIYAAFLYLTSSGDTAKTDKAKNIIVYAVVAIVIAVLAWGITIVAQQLVGGAIYQQP